MSTLATTRMSSKGQIVIPEEIRDRLGLEPGAQFIAVGQDDVVILKRISPLSMEQFDDLIAEARIQAKQAGMKRADVSNAIAEVRGTR